MRLWKIAPVRALALANGFFVFTGLCFLVVWYGGVYDFGRLMPSDPYYAQVYYFRSLLNLGFLVALAVGSVGIWRLKPSGRRLCNAVFVGEILYFVSMTTIPMTIWYYGGDLGLLARALAATGGTGEMGMGYQGLTGYPAIALVILNLTFPESGQDSAKAGGSSTKWRGLAQSAGVLLGVTIGIFYFGNASFILIKGGASGWLETSFRLLAVPALMSFLPVSILGLFRPRAAAYGIASAFVLLQATALSAVAFGWVKGDWSLHGMMHWFFLEILLPCAVAALLFYASAPGAAGATGLSEISR